MHQRERRGAHPRGAKYHHSSASSTEENTDYEAGPQGLAAHERRTVAQIHRVELGAHRAEEGSRRLLRGLEAGVPAS